ncbi:hypothetical protein FSS13T_11420 [Flavobacterium saliperosum S13]|uniref:Lipoprotein n=3 Tax=Flavobacterium saliperosum TaxID=329186 RepID=A0A1G4W3M8_9FLAO|nr:hypothetical protein FSS13T_11420 [Flavobacterium saliperosum S13]SCX16242.1 hypothetical protein SAMN02927925_02360 [Flavobacterium saliperosum]
MKHLFLLITVLFFVSCESQKKATERMTESLVETYFEGWVSGVRGGGAGINFHVIFRTPLAAEIQLEKVVFKGKEAVFTSEDGLHYTAYIITKKGGGPVIEGEEEINEPLPESNKAVLYFKVKGKSEIYTVEDVKEKEMLAYPSMNKPR